MSDEKILKLPEAAQAFARGDVELLPAALAAGDVEALVEALVERADSVRLERLAQSPDKSLAKPARRGLHLLATRGVKPPPGGKREFRVHGPYAEGDLPSLASLIDGHGERIVWFVRANTENGYDVFQAELSEERGLLGFQRAPATRKEWRAHAKKIGDDGRYGVGEIPARHARWLIEKGYRKTLESGRAVPESFAVARLDLGHVDAPERHPATELLPLALDEARPKLAALHQLSEVTAWIPPRESLQALDLELGQIATSKLVVDERQRREQMEAAITREAERALTPELRARLADRLRETALLLQSRGRIDEARLCNAAAALTLDERVGAADNPFVLRLYGKLIDPERVLAEKPETSETQE